MSLLLCLLLSSWCLVDCTFYKTNLTDFSQCKVHYSVQERSYKVFYHIDETDQSNKPNDTLLDFHFSVLAASDAHILLAPSSTVTAKDPVYEIVIGAGGNTFCDIRRMQKNSVRASIRMNGTLSAVDVRSFWIHIYKDGVIDVGKEGEELGFLSWKDPDLLPLKVFSFSTWGNIEAKWFFDCPREDGKTDSELVEPVKTHLERLRYDLLSGYDPYVPPVFDPETKTMIVMKLLSNTISLDERASVMNINGEVLMEWQDEKLIWEPEEYGDIKEMHAFHGEIWKPDVIIPNSKYLHNEEAFSGRLLIVSHDGTVKWRATLNSATFCDIKGLIRWPEDVHTCELDVTFWEHQAQNLRLLYDIEKSKILGNEGASGWRILLVSVLVGNDFAYNHQLEASDNPRLKIYITLGRASDLYVRVFHVPFYVLTTLLLMCFWSSPFEPTKILLLCLHILLTVMILIGITYVLPGHPTQVPYIIYLYCASVVLNVVCAFVEINVISLSRREHLYNPPHVVTKLLTFKCVEYALILPEMKRETCYGKLKGASNKSTTVREMWVRMGTAIDRIAFYVVLGASIFAEVLKH